MPDRQNSEQSTNTVNFLLMNIVCTADDHDLQTNTNTWRGTHVGERVKTRYQARNNRPLPGIGGEKEDDR